jgi:4-hydroxymandelate oxidase
MKIDAGDPHQLEKLLTVDDFEAAAKLRLPQMAYDYFRSGADEEHTLRRNRDAFARYELWYRALVDVSSPRLETTLLGEPVPCPLFVAPTAYHRLADPEGELATARAAAALGCVYCASTLATTTLEDIAAAAPNAVRWFQLYVHKDRSFTTKLVERAKAAGYRAIAVTADTPTLGRRLADARNGFCLPDGVTMQNLLEILPPERRAAGGSELARFVSARHDPSFSWDDLDALAKLAEPLPLIVKGIVRADDAIRAFDHGARAVWVSNHGGRQLDYAPATIDALGGIVEAAKGRGEVFHDGGVRSGTHALIAFGLGARAVGLGRAVVWGLSAAGQPGVERVLTLLKDELALAMKLAGCPDVAAIPADLVRQSRGP